MNYDYIILGGGIAGLYANYLLSNKKYNGILLEKNESFGGRAYEMDFHGTFIKLGAGIMADHNKHLIKLLKKLHIQINSFQSQTNSPLGYEFNMEKAIKDIKKIYKKYHNYVKSLTMKQFLIKYFGNKFTKQFIENCEYYDFIDSDVEYFMKYYDINDMTHEPYEALIIKWKELIDKLVLPNCKNNTEVFKVQKINDNYCVNNNYTAKKIIFALTLKPLMKLTKNINININYNNYIGTVPFVRIYTWHKDGYDDSKIAHFNLVPNQLQKIIVINKNVLMASYSDSKNALYWKKIMHKSKKEQINIVQKKLSELNININKVDDIYIAFWDEGVHYYKPHKNITFNEILKKLSHPSKNVYVVGEIVSKKQGWVEGAIQSVDNLLKY